MADLYHEGSRQLQDRFDSRRIADRLEQVTLHDELTDNDRAFIASADMFFLATADADGWPECSYKGGLPGFVRVLDARTLAFPSYDGNGMFRSLGNVLVNPRVGLLFVDFARPRRLRVQGTASLRPDDPLLAEYPGAQMVVRVHADHLPQLPALHPQDAAGRALRLRAPSRLYPARAGLEAESALPRCPAAPARWGLIERVA
jgi:predicted pyridoxine 5'-phosphate oxidase superfamily flavin-nucleotide-binding protein